MSNLIKVNGEKPFSISSLVFVIGESSSGYTLEMSVDCIDGGEASDWAECSDAIPANKIHKYMFNAKGCWFRLRGNTGEVIVRF